LEILIFILVIVVITFVRAYLKSPTIKGARGEARVRRRLNKRLSGNEYEIYNDVTLPSVMGDTQIDHIVLSRYGVFVIETKNYSGWIYGNAKSRQWTQTLYRKKSQFQNPLHQNFKHIKAVQAFFLIKQNEIHSVVVFVGRSKFKTDLPPHVTDLKGLCPYILSRRAVIFQPAQLDDMTLRLNQLRAGLKPERHDADAIRMEPDCPKCGEPMVRRQAKKGRNAGNEFWGCSGFPSCRGYRTIASLDE